MVKPIICIWLNQQVRAGRLQSMLFETRLSSGKENPSYQLQGQVPIHNSYCKCTYTFFFFLFVINSCPLSTNFQLNYDHHVLLEFRPIAAEIWTIDSLNGLLIWMNQVLFYARNHIKWIHWVKVAPGYAQISVSKQSCLKLHQSIATNQLFAFVI